MPNILNLDPSHRRRASMVQSLSRSGLHCEPYETIEELLATWPCDRIDVALVYDEAKVLERLSLEIDLHCANTSLIAYHPAPSPKRTVDALLHGAIDYLDLAGDLDELPDRIDAALARAEKFGLLNRRSNIDHALRTLSSRQKAVLEHVAAGKTSKMIGTLLGLSPRTVEIHKANIYKKINARNAAEATRIWASREIPKLKVSRLLSNYATNSISR